MSTMTCNLVPDRSAVDQAYEVTLSALVALEANYRTQLEVGGERRDGWVQRWQRHA